MSTDIDPVITDLIAEVHALHQVLADLDTNQWAMQTPAPGWTVSDQVIHLGLFDRRCQWSMADPDRFMADMRAMGSNGGVEGIHDAERSRNPQDLLRWWAEGSRELAEVASALDLTSRCVWYGPPMAARSMLTARVMETWAHGHDIADALGIAMEPTDRLKHIAHIGVRARGFAFNANKKPVPEEDVYVELQAPSGDVWTWGDPESSSSVRGAALAFCQAVTQRRHIDDCAITAVGETAQTWMSIAQAFAGPPGVGRQPGQFS
jgi:uncharacterized protein (TIGR03084 family)